MTCINQLTNFLNAEVENRLLAVVDEECQLLLETAVEGGDKLIEIRS